MERRGRKEDGEWGAIDVIVLRGVTAFACERSGRVGLHA